MENKHTDFDVQKGQFDDGQKGFRNVRSCTDAIFAQTNHLDTGILLLDLKKSLRQSKAEY